VALVIGDVDRFKAMNDAEGHAGGDAALREIAGRLRTHLRAFEPVYRFGGEEFVVLLAGVDAAAAAAVAERLRAAMRAEPMGGRTVTMSFGVAATAPGERCDFHTLFGRADAALYGGAGATACASRRPQRALSLPERPRSSRCESPNSCHR